MDLRTVLAKTFTAVLIAVLIALLFIDTFIIIRYVEALRFTYNEMGNYFDEESEIVHRDQAIIGYGFFAIVFSIALFCVSVIVIRRFKSKS